MASKRAQADTCDGVKGLSIYPRAGTVLLNTTRLSRMVRYEYCCILLLPAVLYLCSSLHPPTRIAWYDVCIFDYAPTAIDLPCIIFATSAVPTRLPCMDGTSVVGSCREYSCVPCDPVWTSRILPKVVNGGTIKKTGTNTHKRHMHTRARVCTVYDMTLVFFCSLLTLFFRKVLPGVFAPYMGYMISHVHHTHTHRTHTHTHTFRLQITAVILYEVYIYMIYLWYIWHFFVYKHSTRFSFCSMLTLFFRKVYPACLLWGIGTAIGEIPPYALSRAAAEVRTTQNARCKMQNRNKNRNRDRNICVRLRGSTTILKNEMKRNK